MKDLVSIIIPVYKVEKYITKCLDSLINQTYANIEIICINDGSPDNSQSILEKYAKLDTRIKLLLQENSGVSAARNNGLRNAQGEYILFVDPDDWCELNLIETALNEFNKDSEIDLVYWGTNIVTEREITEKEYLMHQRANSCYRNGKYPISGSLVKNLTGRISNKLFKTKIVKDYHIEFPATKCYEDLFFNLNYYKYTKNIYFINKNLDNYLLRDNSAVSTMSAAVSAKNTPFAVENLLTLFKQIYNNCKESNSIEQFDKLLFPALFQRLLFNIENIDKKKQYYYLTQIKDLFNKLDKSYDWSQNEDIYNIINNKFYKYPNLNIPLYSLGNKLAGLFVYKGEKSRIVFYILGIKLSFKIKFLTGGKQYV